jgi:hypothetical protein
MIRVRDEATLREGITDFFLGRGYAEGESRFTDELVFDRPSGPSETARTAARVRLRYTRRAEGVWRVVATPLAVESWKSALEAEHAVVSASAQMQGFLNHIKARIEPKL